MQAVATRGKGGPASQAQPGESCLPSPTANPTLKVMSAFWRQGDQGSRFGCRFIATGIVARRRPPRQAVSDIYAGRRGCRLDYRSCQSHYRPHGPAGHLSYWRSPAPPVWPTTALPCRRSVRRRCHVLRVRSAYRRPAPPWAAPCGAPTAAARPRDVRQHITTTGPPASTVRCQSLGDAQLKMAQRVPRFRYKAVCWEAAGARFGQAGWGWPA